jgi:hypothetical protein
MFLPFFKIVQKMHTRWSQVTKEQKMRQTQDNKTLEKETIKKTTARIKTRKLAENVGKEIHQKKPLSHRVIKKPTRKRNITDYL